MPARHAVLLTPLECAVPICIPIGILNAPVTPLKSALASPSQTTENTATLSLVDSALTSFPPVNSLECALTKNTGGGIPPCGCQSAVLFARFFRSLHQERFTTLFYSEGSALFLKTAGSHPSSQILFSLRACRLAPLPPTQLSALLHYFLTSLLPYLSPVQSLRFHPGEK
jgi:hypothetical protein